VAACGRSVEVVEDLEDVEVDEGASTNLQNLPNLHQPLE
jgi:hypothetical protein